MGKEFTISKMDPDVKTVRGFYTGRVYRQVANEWWEWENEWRETIRITWFALLAKETKAFEVPFGSVGSLVNTQDLYNLPLMTVVRDATDHMFYVKSGENTLMYVEDDELVNVLISDLRNKFVVEWTAEGGEV